MGACARSLWLAHGNAYIGVTDLETPRVYQPRKLAGTFPNIEMVTPAIGRELYKAGFNVDLFISVLKQMSDFLKAERLPVATLRFYGERNAVRIDAHNSDTEQEMTAVIMPVNLGTPSDAEAGEEIRIMAARIAALRKDHKFSEARAPFMTVRPKSRPSSSTSRSR